MSARQLQRLRQQLEQQQQQKQVVQKESEEEEVEEQLQSKPLNPFDLLTDEDEDELKEEVEEEVEVSQSHDNSSPSMPKLPQEANQNNKKKNKKRKSKKDKSKNQQGSGDVQNIDQILEELNLKPITPNVSNQQNLGSNSNANQSQINKDLQQSTGPILAIDTKYLKPELELRKIFGNQVVDEEEARAEAEQRRRLPRNVRLPSIRKGILITPRFNWPPVVRGLSMDHLGNNRYQYVYSASYNAVQELFEQYQAGFDPNNIVQLLQDSPYHLDSLLAMHDLYRATGEHATAEEMINRCLYGLETAWHPTFRPNNKCTLKFEFAQNRPFFKAMFKHLVSLGRQGCHRTALECCKFVLGLEEDDPMGMIFCMDYYAIRGGEYAWLVRFINEYGNDNNLMVLPNILFSFALSKFKLRQEEGVESTGLNPDDQLLQAIFTFPMVVVALLEKLKSLGVSDWGQIITRPLFSKHKGYEGSTSLEHLVGLFVQRSHLLWKVPQTLLWFKKGCLDACNRYEEGGQLLLGCTFDDWATVRQLSYPMSEDNEYRHLRLEEFGDDLSTIPREELNAAMGQRGVEEAALEEEIRRLQQQARQGMVQVSEEELRGSNTLMMLVRSLLPWVDAGAAPEDGRDPQRSNEDQDDGGQ